MLKRRPPHDLHQMLLWYVGEYVHVQNTSEIESARDLLMEADKNCLKIHDVRGFVIRWKVNCTRNM